MDNNNLFLKKSIYASIITFSICIIAMLAFIPGLTFEEINPTYAGIFTISMILLSISSIAIFVLMIIMIVKICTMQDVPSTDKIIWSILIYFFNTFVLAFAYEKFISRTNNYKDATKLVIFHGISIVLAIVAFFIAFINTMNGFNF